MEIVSLFNSTDMKDGYRYISNIRYYDCDWMYDMLLMDWYTKYWDFDDGLYYAFVNHESMKTGFSRLSTGYNDLYALYFQKVF